MLALRSFTGMIPRLAPELLPDTAAQYARDCDFAHGELRGLRGLDARATAAVSPVRSLYSPDGQRFFAWSREVDAVTSPVPNDTAPRVYFTDNSQVWLAFEDMLSLTPSEPITKYLLGVPAPTAPPQTIVGDAEELPLDIAGFKATFWYEDGGVKFQTTPVALVEVVRGRTYAFTVPVKAVAVEGEDADTAATPAAAILAVQIAAITADGETVFEVISSQSVFGKGSSAITGGVTAEATLTNETTAEVHLVYGESEDRAYIYTHVNPYGEESAPSDPVVVAADALNQVTVVVEYEPSEKNYIPVSKLRLYRSNTASTGLASFQFCKDQPVGEGGTIHILDDVDPALLGDVLVTEDWYPPPTGLQGLVDAGNGILAAYRGDELHFAIEYVPYAWNPFNVVTLPYGIVGLCTSPMGLVVVTSAYPYLVSGVSADAMTSSRIPAIQGGASHRGIADLGTEVVYTSYDGLVAVGNGTANIELSQHFWTRDDWRTTYTPAALQLAAHDGYLIGFSSSSQNFVARLDEAAGTLTEWSEYGDGAFVVPSSDGLYYSQGAKINRFSSGSRMPFVWHSKDFILAKPENFGVAQVVLGASGNFEIAFYADGELKHTESVSGMEKVITFRLPSGFMARRWSVRFEGAGVLKEFFMATAGVELGNQ